MTPTYEFIGNNKQTACLARDTPEWERAWESVAADLVNASVTGDRLDGWQYMGSALCTTWACWVHEFRHRNHPTTGSRAILRVPAIAIPTGC